MESLLISYYALGWVLLAYIINDDPDEEITLCNAILTIFFLPGVMIMLGTMSPIFLVFWIFEKGCALIKNRITFQCHFKINCPVVWRGK